MGKMPEEEDYEVNAEIFEVRKNPPGPSLTAVIALKGQFVIADGPAAINGQIYFTFVPSDPESADRGRTDETAEKRKSGLAARFRRPNGGRLRREGLDHQGLDRRGTHHGDTRW